jgi:uncharacterized protein (UPF0276 family)
MPGLIQTPVAGAGLGLRSRHYQDILQGTSIPWFEALTENYFGDGGLPLHFLERIRNDYPITLHGVGMSLGSTDPLDFDYLAKLKALIARFEPAFVSDHLAWISAGQRYVHDLLPLPCTQEALEHVAARVREVQDYLGVSLLIENPSSYMAYTDVDMSEWDFLAALIDAADCDILFDVNNAYVTSRNQGVDPMNYLRALPGDRIREIHLAGYEEQNNYLFDTHGQRVHDPVWELYAATIDRFGPIPTLIEWDTDIPEFQVLVDEANTAQAVLDQYGRAA